MSIVLCFKVGIPLVTNLQVGQKKLFSLDFEFSLAGKIQISINALHLHS